MRKTKTLNLTVNDVEKPVTVYEIRPRDVIELFQSKENLKDGVDQLLPKCVTLSTEELIDLYPSDTAQVWSAFQEVNAAFFALLRATGVEDQIRDLLRMAMTDLRARLAGQYSMAITALSNTAGSSS